MITTEEFPTERWQSRLEGLTREARERPMSIRVEGPNVGDQVLAEFLPLVAISLESKGTEKGAVEIIAEHPNGGHLTHLINNPEHIYLARYNDRQVLCLDIEDRRGVKTLVFLRQSSADVDKGGTEQ